MMIVDERVSVAARAMPLAKLWSMRVTGITGASAAAACATAWLSIRSASATISSERSASAVTTVTGYRGSAEPGSRMSSARSISASEVAGLAIGTMMRSGESPGSNGFRSSSSARACPARSTIRGPTSPVTRIISTTALTTSSSKSPISSPTKVTASVAAACGTESPKATSPSRRE